MGNTAKAKKQTHDTDLLLASNVSVFKQWLITQGIAITAPDHANIARGVHYWVEVPGCKPVSVQEAFGRKTRYAQTHYRLRPLLNGFLTSPMASAIKEIVRHKPAGPLQVVVSGKVQPPAKAANSEVPAILQAQTKNSGEFLLSGADIGRALNIDSPIPEGALVKHVFGARVAGGVGRGLTVVAHMKVYERAAPNGRTCRVAEVVDYPIHTDRTDIEQQAAELFGRASALPNATILVDVMGLGIQFLKHLEAMQSPTVKRYGLMMGQPLPKRGDAARFYNRRAECSVLAAQAIKSGDLKLARPLSLHASNYDVALELLGSKMPYSFDELGRYRLPKAADREELPSPDLFEAISLAYLSTELPIAAEKPAKAQPSFAVVLGAPAKPLDKFLIELRDDFALTCPLVKDAEESMGAFANRRWVYAQAMIEARPV
jgi:hypothetical protein